MMKRTRSRVNFDQKQLEEFFFQKGFFRFQILITICLAAIISDMHACIINILCTFVFCKKLKGYDIMLSFGKSPLCKNKKIYSIEFQKTRLSQGQV